MKASVNTPAGRRNIGIFAHVDAGKTTTTEQMLFASGRIRTAGSVDDGTAQTDSLEVERARGISVRAAVTRFAWQGIDVNLVDTPGHVDFLAEVERSLRVMDGAILIVSAAEGVQAQTEVVWQALRELNLPTILYVNKMDRIGADPDGVLQQIRRLLSTAAVPVQAPVGTEDGFRGTVDLLEAGGRSGRAVRVGRCVRPDAGRGGGRTRRSAADALPGGRELARRGYEGVDSRGGAPRRAVSGSVRGVGAGRWRAGADGRDGRAAAAARGRSCGRRVRRRIQARARSGHGADRLCPALRRDDREPRRHPGRRRGDGRQDHANPQSGRETVGGRRRA
nr:GTP-binding protein [Cohnella ginsengisoli]